MTGIALRAPDEYDSVYRRPNFRPRCRLEHCTHSVEEDRMRYFAKALLVAAVVLSPDPRPRQSLAGTVRDASGAVLPGVTVEAASPALIEKVRTAVTDGTGQYRIERSPSRHLHGDLHAARLHAPSSAKASRSAAPASSPSTPSCASAASRRRSPSPARRRSSTSQTARARRRCSTNDDHQRAAGRRAATATCSRPCPALQATGTQRRVTRSRRSSSRRTAAAATKAACRSTA